MLYGFASLSWIKKSCKHMRFFRKFLWKWLISTQNCWYKSYHRKTMGENFVRNVKLVVFPRMLFIMITKKNPLISSIFCSFYQDFFLCLKVRFLRSVHFSVFTYLFLSVHMKKTKYHHEYKKYVWIIFLENTFISF